MSIATDEFFSGPFLRLSPRAAPFLALVPNYKGPTALQNEGFCLASRQIPGILYNWASISTL